MFQLVSNLLEITMLETLHVIFFFFFFVKLIHTWIVCYGRCLDSVVVVCADCCLQECDVTFLQGIDKETLSMDPVVSGS